MSSTILVTGGAGFIGHHYVEYLLANTKLNVIIIDSLNYASHGLDRLKANKTYDDPRVNFISWDLCQPISVGVQKLLKDVEQVVHFAAETHVDNSIADAKHCILTNIKSTIEILESVKKMKRLKKFIYFSTDEVYGTARLGQSFRETDRHNPTNPYSASKSASEGICTAYSNTFNIPVIIIHAMNVFGSRQHKEKFIPMVVHKLLEDEPLLIHCYEDGKTPGSRFYIHASKIAEAVQFIIKHGVVGECYNVRGQKEINNEDLLLKIANYMKTTPQYTLTHYDVKRPGHDLRYDISGEKLTKLGYKVTSDDFDKLLFETVKFTVKAVKAKEKGPTD